MVMYLISTVINSSLLDASITSVAFFNNEQIVNLCHFYLLTLKLLIFTQEHKTSE